MKAAVYRTYGSPSVVEIAEVPTPSPRPREVLVRIHAATVSTADWRARSLVLPPGFGPFARLAFGIFGPRKPILGTELSGVVEAVGDEVTRFKVGDEVFAFPEAGFGSHAEYKAIDEAGSIALKPAKLSFEEAAALSFGGTTALVFLRDKARVARGERVLIVGASGCVGTAAVQLARHFGAEVTGVCSTANVELVRADGAHEVIDYTRQDFAERGEAWDIILDTTGTVTLAQCERALKPGGRLLRVLGSFTQSLGLERLSKGRKVLAGVAMGRREDLELLAGLAESGVYRPVIDRCLPLERASEAHAFVESGRKRGSVVLTMVRG